MQFIRVLTASGVVLIPSALFAQTAVPKTNPMPIYMHMMPWFQSPLTAGTNNWGYHWKMNTQNPNTIDPATGQREIASHYYPLTGPYDSTDSTIIEYQMLLMKLSGINGVILDWYGTAGSNGDVSSLLSASNTIVNATNTYGLKFAAMLEDRFSRSPADVTTNINYLRNNYFNKSNYITTGTGANAQPLMPIFGPINNTSFSTWNTILANSPGTKIDILPLWYQSQQVGTIHGGDTVNNAGGEFSWIYEDAGTNNHLSHQQNFLTVQAPALRSQIPNATIMGAAYPGFNDFYGPGGTGTVIPFNPIPSNNGQTLASVLALDKTYAANMDALQLETFNDYGEGTMFEPTLQTGFSYLMQIQQFTGVSYGLSQLEMVFQLYEERTANTGNKPIKAILDQASADINNLDFTDAQTLLDQYHTDTWTGNAGNNNLSTSSNWSVTAVPTNSLVFAGTKNLSINNDFPAQTQFNGLTFAAGAGAFTITGYPISLYGDITNNSTNLQTINTAIALVQNTNITTAAGDITITAPISDGLYGPAGLNKLGPNTLTLSGPHTYTGATTVSAGTLTIATGASIASTAIAVSTGATLNINGSLPTNSVINVAGGVHLAGNTAPAPLSRTFAAINLTTGGAFSVGASTPSSGRTVLTLGALNFNGAVDSWLGQLDLGANDLIVHSGSVGAIANQIKQGYNGGNWAGAAGITCSAAANSISPKAALAYELNDNGSGAPLTTTFDGQAVSNTDVLVKYTLVGDTNLDGSVNFSDLLAVAQNYSSTNTAWTTGDFNYDGHTNFSDLLGLAQNYNQTLSLTASQVSQLNSLGGASFAAKFAQAQAQASVPEPAIGGAIVAASLLLHKRRRIRSRYLTSPSARNY